MIKQTTNLTYSSFGESMKVDELLKRLENVKTDEDEKHEVAEYITQVMGFDDLQYKYNSI